MSPDAQYTRSFSRRYPGLFIILLDQSHSMNQQMLNRTGQTATKAEYATTALNTIIQEMINAADYDDEAVRKKYAYLSILGYNNTVYPLLYNTDTPIDIANLANNPIAVGKRIRSVPVSPGKFRQVSEKLPIWIKPHAEGTTQMDKAFIHARDIALRWLNSRPEPNQAERKDCFPPIIINITDAKHNGEGDPLAVSEEIRTYGTEQGNILIFNCHFTDTLAQPIIFPGHINQVENLDEYGLAKNIFLMSSTIPRLLRNEAALMIPKQQSLHTNARCFVYNADPDILIKFLRWGTQKRNVQSEAGRAY